MMVATSSGPTACASLRHSGCRASAAAPRRSTSASEITPGPASPASNAITSRSAGSRSRMLAILASWTALETRMAETPASRRMYSICLEGRVG